MSTKWCRKMNKDKQIRFIDTQHNTLFYIPNNSYVDVVNIHTGEKRSYLCEYIDDDLIKFGNHVLDIWQLAVIMEKLHNRLIPRTSTDTNKE